MAEALVKKIEKNFLSCCVCYELLNDPVGLPCLHTFCFKCLENWHKTSENRFRVTCPACKTPALVPEDGIRGFPGHFLVKNLKETVDREKTKVESSRINEGSIVRIIRASGAAAAAASDDIKDEDVGIVQNITEDEMTVILPKEVWKGSTSQVELWTEPDDGGKCELCEKPSKSYCLNCKQYLCDQCCQNHNAFKAMKNHEVVAASDVRSGKISSAGRHCEVHNEPVKYFCTTEGKQVCQDCISLKVCPLEHDRIALTKAARQLVITLQQLLLEGDRKRGIYRELLDKTGEMKSGLQSSYDKAKEDLEKVKSETNQKLEEMWEERKVSLARTHAEKEEVLTKGETDMHSKLKEAQKANDMVLDVITNGSDYDVTYKYAEMKSALESIALQPDPKVLDESQGDLQFDAGKPDDYVNTNPQAAKAAKSSGRKSPRDSWYLLISNKLADDLRDISDLGQHDFFDMAISSRGAGVKIFDNRGQVKCSLQNAPRTVNTCVMTADHRVIIDGRNRLLKYSSEDGKLLGTIKTKSFDSPDESAPVAVTLDDDGRIIAALEDGTINIYYADGTLQSQMKFTRPAIYISSLGRVFGLVVTFDNKTVALISYKGDIHDYFLSPPDVLHDDWDPGATCCNRGDIYIVNRTHPKQVYAYRTARLRQVEYNAETGMYNVRTISFAEDGDSLRYIDENGVVHLYFRNK